MALTELREDVTDAIRQVLAAAWPEPLPTSEIQDLTGYDLHYGNVTYLMLARLARGGEAEKISVPGRFCRYWRLALPPAERKPFP